MKRKNEWQKVLYFTVLLGLFVMLICRVTDAGGPFIRSLIISLNVNHPGIVTALTWALFGTLLFSIYHFYTNREKTDRFRIAEELMYLGGHLFITFILAVAVYFIVEPIRDADKIGLKAISRLLYLLSGLNYGNLMLSIWKAEHSPGRLMVRFKKR
ncbi:MAG: hypothetical protein WBA74_26090 [Cyclobacteriaceae bacterium]